MLLMCCGKLWLVMVQGIWANQGWGAMSARGQPQARAWCAKLQRWPAQLQQSWHSVSRDCKDLF